MPGNSAFSSSPAIRPPSDAPPDNSGGSAAGGYIGGVERLALFQKFEDFVDWFEPIVERFPVYERYVLCTILKNLMYGIYEKIIRTNKMKNKLPGWYEIDVELIILRRYITRTRKKGSKYLSKKSHETAVKKLLEIGKLLGGLIRKG